MTGTTVTVELLEQRVEYALLRLETALTEHAPADPAVLGAPAGVTAASQRSGGLGVIDARAQVNGHFRAADRAYLEASIERVNQELLAAVIERGKAEEDVTRAIATLRRAGGSWNLIGPALGVSRQSARERYALVDDGD